MGGSAATVFSYRSATRLVSSLKDGLRMGRCPLYRTLPNLFGPMVLTWATLASPGKLYASLGEGVADFRVQQWLRVLFVTRGAVLYRARDEVTG